MVLWQYMPGKDAQLHTPHPLPQPTLKLKPLQMKLFFSVTSVQTVCFLCSEELHWEEGKKVFPLSLLH